jgi:Truncated, possibly inactive, lysyl-tRNA synthetase (class II)
MNDYQIILSRDLLQCLENDTVCVTGIIFDKWGKKDRFGISLKDLTGIINVRFGNNNGKCYTKGMFVKGKRVRIYATVVVDREGNKCLGSVDNVEFLQEISQLNKELDILEQESLVMLSKICNKIRMHLGKLGFIEVNTRVISRYLGDEILEPLLAEYPGFGTSAYLAPSPSSQLSEFLAVTLLPKVFTETISFTTSYRFPNGSTETPIIMAKAINLSIDDEKDIILRISKSIVDSLSDKTFRYITSHDEWNEELPIQKAHENGVFRFSTYSTNIPTIGRKWNSIVHTIGRFEDDRGNLLVENSTELINESTNISTFTFYPSQYLNWISKAPKRQLLNLWKVYDGGNMYG